MICQPTLTHIAAAAVYAVMAVGHEWGWRRYDASSTNGSGIFTLSNYPFFGATNVSSTAKATAIKYGLYDPTAGGAFDFGAVFGLLAPHADPTRQERTEGLLNRLRSEHALTKADMITTLSDHACTHRSPPDGPPVTEPHFFCTEVDELSWFGGITASSMLSDFTTDGRRKIAWHALTNPSMSVYYPIIFHHDGRTAQPPPWLRSEAPWWAFRYVTYHLARGSALKVQKVRDTWRPIQLRFFREAEALADAVNDMSATDADAALAVFMANVSSTMHATLLHLNHTLL